MCVGEDAFRNKNYKVNVRVTQLKKKKKTEIKKPSLQKELFSSLVLSMVPSGCICR